MTLIHSLHIAAILATSFATPHQPKNIPSPTLFEAQAKRDTAWKEAISNAALEELRTSGTPSLQIAIGYKGRILFEKAYGIADLENNIAATTETKYRSASVSKWWTATATMILAEQGKLDLDAPIQTYCPHFPVKKWPVTARHLLTHTAGIRSYIDREEVLSNALNKKDSANVEQQFMRELLGMYTRYTNLQGSLENFKEDSLLFEPGTTWGYSSQGYRLLGCVLEDATGMSYPQLVNELIFQPTGMEHTTEDDAWAVVPHRASGYRIQRGNPVRNADLRDVSENLPAGGHLTTAGDMVRFAQAFMNETYVSSTFIHTMSSPYFATGEAGADLPSWRYAIPSAENYGYGIMLFPDAHTTKMGHTGRQAGGSAIVVGIPDKNLSIAVMTNAKGWNGFIGFTMILEDIITRHITDLE